MATHADKIHGFIKSALDSGCEKTITSIVMNFFDRVCLTSWRVNSFCVQLKTWSIEIERIDGTKETVSYQSERNAWSIGCHRISDADLSEMLGTPISYLQGISDTIEWFNEKVLDISKLHFDLLKKESELKDGLEKLDESWKKNTKEVAFQKETRKAKHKAGYHASKKIAKIKKENEALKREMAVLKNWAESKVSIADRESASSASKALYPCVPDPFMLVPTSPNDSFIPESSGIYFSWKMGHVSYVGQSANLRQRVNVSHERLSKSDMVSWVEIPKEQLNFAECYYIAICQPTMNFGGWRKNSRKSNESTTV